jgi:hypothetical protein
MYIFLLILKIIGIIILSILGLLLVILAIVLFSPVRYKAKLEAADEICADGLVTYLHFIRANVTLRGTDFRLRVTLFKKELFSIGDDEDGDDENCEADNQEPLVAKSTKPNSKKEEKASNNGDEALKNGDEALKNGDEALKNGDKALKNGDEALKSGETTSKNKKADESDLNDKATYAEQKVKADNTSKKGDLWADKIRDLAEKLYGKLEALYHKLEEAWKIIEAGGKDVETFFKRKSTKFTLELLKTTLMKLVKHVKPQKLSGELTLGMEDPAITGYICAVMGIFYDDYLEAFEFTPDFTEKKLEGNARASGRLLIGYIIYLALNMYLKKQVRYCIKNIGILKSSTLGRIDEIKSAVNL